MTRPATEKQLYWVDKMLTEKGITAEEMANRTGFAYSELTTKTAGAWLDILFAAADKAREGHTPVTEAGLYIHDGVVYRVQFNRSRTNLYAKELVIGSGFVYSGGAIRKLDASEAMSADEARAFGVQTGHCANCGEGLEDPISIDIGLGTHCGPKLMGRPAYNQARREAKAKPEVQEAIAAREGCKATAAVN